ncbi:MAG: SURF1 family protein, partial [Actinobacteria bacterium]|nr:SURF1 family protein [Actinomycetota bacterium]
MTRHHRNAIIASHVNLPTAQLDDVSSNPLAAEWRKVKTQGTFSPKDQILLRNKYFDGKYGFELLTLFHTSDGKNFWVNRGWIAPGSTASAKPKLPLTSTQPQTIQGRLRLDRSLPQGSFFAISKSGGNLIVKWNA